MRIVIEIDGNNVAVHTDRQPLEADAASIVDAGSAPAELLREFGGIGVTEAEGDYGSDNGESGQYGSRPEKGTLNPLRAGEAVARQQLGYPPRHESEPVEIIDAGGPPKLSKRSGKQKNTKRSSKKK